MIQFDDKTTEALEYVRKAEKIMAELGHTKYSLSGMCSAAMRHDLEKEVCQLLDELSEARKQRDSLEEALHSIRHRLGDFQEPWNSRETYIDTIAHQAIAAVKGGSHE